MHHYQVLDEDGSRFWTLLSDRTAWSPGELIPRLPQDTLQVIRFTEAEPEDSSGRGYLIVKPAGTASLIETRAG